MIENGAVFNDTSKQGNNLESVTYVFYLQKRKYFVATQHIHFIRYPFMEEPKSSTLIQINLKLDSN